MEKYAPPTIDITIKEEAILLSSPRSFIPNANMVGNMIDIKKGAANNCINCNFSFYENGNGKQKHIYYRIQRK